MEYAVSALESLLSASAYSNGIFLAGLALSSAIRANARLLRKRRHGKFHRTAVAVGIFAFQTHPLQSAVKMHEQHGELFSGMAPASGQQVAVHERLFTR